MRTSTLSVAVIGLGSMGSALIAALAANGCRVRGVEADAAGLERGRELVRSRAEEIAGPAGDIGPILGNIGYGTSLTEVSNVSDVDVVVEALPERVELKCALLRRMHEVCGEDVVFVTTTSGHSVSEIASHSGRTARTVGLHAMPTRLLSPGSAVEVVVTAVAEPSAVALVRDLVRLLGATPVEVAGHVETIGAPLLLGLFNDAVAMHAQGYATPEEIDTAMTLGCGLPTGPLAQLDVMGVDVVHDSLSALHRRTGDQRFEPAPLLAVMREAGVLGRKSGRGFHDYRASGPQPGDPRPDGPAPAPVHSVGVVGSGTMAAGIAEVCARAGFATVLVARTDEKAARAVAAVASSMNRAVTRGKLGADDAAAALDRLSCASELGALESCDLVVEAVVEDLPIKRKLFADLGEHCADSALLATSTSSLPVTECATATAGPENVLGLHFFNPAPVMRLLELVRTEFTSDEAVARAAAFGAALGKRVVTCRDRTGFVVNALLFPYLNSAAEMMRELGVPADDVDEVMTRGHGNPLGPIALLDVVGVDVALAIQTQLHNAFPESAPPPAGHIRELAEAGRLGRKTGRGFRDHSAR